MKKKIIIGSIFSVAVLILVSSVSAVDYHTVVQGEKTQIVDQVKTIGTMEASVVRAQTTRTSITSIKNNIEDLQSKLSTKEKIHLLQSVLQSSHNKFSTTGLIVNLIDLVYFLLLFYFAWLHGVLKGTIPYLPFWVYVVIIIIYIGVS
jgi:hypothetical protein